MGFFIEDKMNELQDQNNNDPKTNFQRVFYGLLLIGFGFLVIYIVRKILDIEIVRTILSIIGLIIGFIFVSLLIIGIINSFKNKTF